MSYTILASKDQLNTKIIINYTIILLLFLPRFSLALYHRFLCHSMYADSRLFLEIWNFEIFSSLERKVNIELNSSLFTVKKAVMGISYFWAFIVAKRKKKIGKSMQELRIVIFYTEIFTGNVVLLCFFTSETSEKIHKSTFEGKISV